VDISMNANATKMPTPQTPASGSAAASLGVSDEERWDVTKPLREFAGKAHNKDWR